MPETFIAPAHLELNSLMLAADEEGSSDDPNEIWTPIKCFLCDHAFVEGEEPWLIFEKRLHEDGHMECALSKILESALGREIDETVAHSTLLCDACNATILEFEELEQRFSEMRYRILSAYNNTARKNDILPIAIEINGVLQTYNDLPNIKADALPQILQHYIEPLANIHTEDNSISQRNLVETISQDELNAELDAAALVDEVKDEEQEEDYYLENGLKPVSTDDSSKYTFAIMQQEPLPTQQVPMAPLEFSTIKEEALSVPGLHHIDGQDVIIYDEIIEQSTQASYNEEDETEIKSIAYSNSQQIEDNGGDISIHADMQESLKCAPFTSRQSLLYHQQNESYFCLQCDPAEPLDPPNFVEHMRSAHKTRFYTCELCYAGFLRRQDLSDHMEEQHIDSKNEAELAEEATGSSYPCETCHRVFTNYRLFRIHKRMHYSSVKQFECSECHKKYSSRNLLEEHMNMHTGERPFKCSHCPKDFASKYTLQTHLKIHSERERPFSCDECDKSFLNAQNLAAHKRLHVGVKSYVCDVCQKAFGTQHNLNVHKIMHSGARPFICRTCGKSFARRPEVKDHERIHSGERPFKCNLCPLAFAQRSNLQSHKKMTHLNEKQHACTQCDRSFKRRRLLEYHINAVHTGQRPFKCDVCAATFVYPEHHKKHMLIHTGDKPFACEVCGKQFNSRDNRNAHRFIHSDKKPYECLDCGMGFMRKPLLLAHMKHTRHSSDTIIVNQPQISFGTTEHVTTAIPIVDDNVFNRYMNAVEDDNEQKKMSQDDQEEEGANNIEENGRLIKDEIGDVKYLQFEDLDRDGQQTLTWVDIGGDKD